MPIVIADLVELPSTATALAHLLGCAGGAANSAAARQARGAHRR
jgi:hypothetical protein